MAERDLTAREDRFIGLCLGALAIIMIFLFILTKAAEFLEVINAA